MLKIRCKDHPDFRGRATPALCNGCWYVFGVRMFIHGSEDDRLQFMSRGEWRSRERDRTVEGGKLPMTP